MEPICTPIPALLLPLPLPLLLPPLVIVYYQPPPTTTSHRKINLEPTTPPQSNLKQLSNYNLPEKLKIKSEIKQSHRHYHMSLPYITKHHRKPTIIKIYYIT